jgi:uncharacterized protein YjbI with pentapeptide repeats
MTIYHKNGTIITDQYDSIEAAVKAGVSLRYADLTGANLVNADLRGAYLTDAVLYLGNRRITV